MIGLSCRCIAVDDGDARCGGFSSETSNSRRGRHVSFLSDNNSDFEGNGAGSVLVMERSVRRCSSSGLRVSRSQPHTEILESFLPIRRDVECCSFTRCTTKTCKRHQDL